MLAVDVGSSPRSLIVVFGNDAGGVVDQVHVIGIEHFVGHEVRDALDVNDGNIRNAGAGLNGHRDLLIQVIRGHRGVVDVDFVLRSVERIDHALHGCAVAAGEDGPVVDFYGSHSGGRCEQHRKGQHESQSFLH